MRTTTLSVKVRASTARLRPTSTALISRSSNPKTHFGVAFSSTSRAAVIDGETKGNRIHGEFGAKEVEGKNKGKEVEGVGGPLNNNQSVRFSLSPPSTEHY